MTEDMNTGSDTTDQTGKLLAVHIDKVTRQLNRFLDDHGVSITVLGNAMGQFTRSVPDLPEEAACDAGCAFCCHLGVELSIPELLVIFCELTSRGTPEELSALQKKILEITQKGNTLDKGFWRTTQTPCPFLDHHNQCLIYIFRPFSCRAYHSVDLELCRQGFENRCQVQIPCFPMYRAATGMFASVFVKVLADRGFASYPVSLVKGLDMLFKDRSLVDQWLLKKDLFQAAGA